MNKRYFGDKETFAIRYVPEFKSNYQGGSWFYAYLHLQLGGHIIGTIEENCFVSTWIHKARLLLDRLNNEFEKFSHREFLGRTDQEIFELVSKATQLNDEFDPQYAYLPQIEHSFWVHCRLTLDETIDAYSITITSSDNKLNFIWKGLREPCPENEIGILRSLTVDKEIVVKALDECITFVENDLKNYIERG